MARPTAIISIQDDNDLRWPRVIVYGDPGVGKTPMIGTEPRSLILEADPGGTLSARVRGSQADKWKVRRFEDLSAVHEYMRHEGHEIYKWCWLDGITIFGEYGLRQIMEEKINSPTGAHRKLWAPDKGEYRDKMSRLRLWLEDMVELPVALGITAHVDRYTDVYGEEHFAPAIQGKGMVDFFCGFMNIIAYMEVDDGVRVLHTSKDTEYYGKDRYEALPGGELKNPTIPKLDSLIDRALAAKGMQRGGTPTPAKKAAKKAVPVKKATKATKAAKATKTPVKKATRR